MPGLSDFGLREQAVDEHTHVVEPSGEIDFVTAPQLGRCLLALAEKGRRDVVVDLSEVTFMDSTGIGVILNSLRKLAPRNKLVLVCPTDRILRPFQVTGLASRLQIVRSRKEALGRLSTA